MVILANKQPCLNGVSCDTTLGYGNNNQYREPRKSQEFASDHASPICKIVPDDTETCKKEGKKTQYRYF